ncbi:MAG: NYN domain-containing protein [Coriobacteriia bacterium]|nr:NYN domain-containing protein [Coriobacteriia bacterium]
MPDFDNSIAVFIDYENMALGMNSNNGGRRKTLFQPDIGKILERLLEKGRIVAKRAYCDWQRFPEAVSYLHGLGVDLLEIPDNNQSGKNSADIRLAVDAIELCHNNAFINTFVIVSGDSDFTPLVSRLKENGKTIIGVGMRESTSELLAVNCDEFIFYEDIGVAADIPTIPDNLSGEKRKAYELLFDSIEALQRENVETMHSSMIKDAIRRKAPQFTEAAYGYRSFTRLLEEAQDHGLIKMHKDEKSGTWVVEGFSA